MRSFLETSNVSVVHWWALILGWALVLRWALVVRWALIVRLAVHHWIILARRALVDRYAFRLHFRGRNADTVLTDDQRMR
jgi:hypothetical protein